MVIVFRLLIDIFLWLFLIIFCKIDFICDLIFMLEFGSCVLELVKFLDIFIFVCFDVGYWLCVCRVFFVNCNVVMFCNLLGSDYKWLLLMYILEYVGLLFFSYCSDCWILNLWILNFLFELLLFCFFIFMILILCGRCGKIFVGLLIFWGKVKK